MARLARLLAALALSGVSSALAQQAPDAGRVLRELGPGVPAPAQPLPGVRVERPAEAETAPGGATVTLSGVRFRGNTVFDEAALAAVLGEVSGRRYDLAGLRGLARRITEHYRRHGYVFARAFLPEQTLADGVLEIRIIEGRYGRIEVQGEAAARGYLEALVPGAVIEASALERAALLLSELPGYRVEPLLRPGQEIGTGDLLVTVERDRLFRAELGADNHGNRYTGRHRLRARLQADSPFAFGDQLRGQLLYSDEDLWLGSLDYSLPLGTQGLRGQIGYSRTSYELGKDFRDLRAYGTVKAASAGLSYPLLRSRAANLALSVAYQRRSLEDRQEAINTRFNKSSRVVPVTLQFDRTDASGISWGALAYTAGRLKLDSALEAADIASNTDTRGRYDKWNLDVARLQRTSIAELTLLGRLSVQGAGKNLDSSESFILGGATGVRAYPQGEGAADEGAFVQLEARYRIGQLEPFVFYDAGRARINAEPARIVPPVVANTRSLAGAGLGLRYAGRALTLEASAAWRTQGGRPLADTRDDRPMVWASVIWRFE
ncbi:MAG: ShlB/FhaC/HecB family hemolysin secretion/activation protein [Casimicrobiaceae bacterium]|nr:ShlB/FhaC/HecB family hemolysin secretion/activation protein [Casimicrobiaceae bacterium]